MLVIIMFDLALNYKLDIVLVIIIFNVVSNPTGIAYCVRTPFLVFPDLGTSLIASSCTKYLDPRRSQAELLDSFLVALEHLCAYKLICCLRNVS